VIDRCEATAGSGYAAPPGSLADVPVQGLPAEMNRPVSG
jgi:hypothetical protein